MTTKSEITFTRYASPIGELLLVGEIRAPRGGRSALALKGIYFAGAPHAEGVVLPAWRDEHTVFARVIEQLDAYFAGERTSFELDLAPEGTAFQRDVWRALSAIPYGTTKTYADVARSIGRPNAVRAVGAANGRNPLSIVVPCHRVVGRDGTLTGYAGGLAHKAALLALERRAGGVEAVWG